MSKNISHYPKILWFLQLSYTAVILLANWFDIRLIKIGPVETDAGTLIFPLTFMLSDLITEVYGYKFARISIWAGFIFNFIFVAYSQLVVHLPSPAYAISMNSNFDSIVGFNARIIFASTISYLCSEPLNSYVLSKLKIKTMGRYIPLRFVCSTLMASLVDSFIFGTLAFADTMPNHDLIVFNLTMWIVKVIVEVLGLPVSINLAKKLKRIEKLDTYDTGTKFNVFSLDTVYQKQNNHYANA